MAKIFGFPPFIHDDSRVLILGSMPSIASLEANFYYAHPQNRFFKILSSYLNRPLNTLEERKEALKSLKVALFDVIKCAEREGSLDSSIRNYELNDFETLFARYTKLQYVITNGSLAQKLFVQYIKNETYMHKCSFEIVHLPSTSAANAKYSLKKLCELYFPFIALAGGSHDN